MQAMGNTDVVQARSNRIALVPSPTRAALPRPGSAGEGCGAKRIVEKATRPTLLGLRSYIFSRTKAPFPYITHAQSHLFSSTVQPAEVQRIFAKYADVR